MDDIRTHFAQAEQRELDEDQSMLELDQSIGDREQARANQDQSTHDQKKLALDGELAATNGDAFEIRAAIAQRDGELMRAQVRRDAHQAQLDDNQNGLERRQLIIDAGQHELENPSAAPLQTTPEQLAAAARARDTAARLRAVAAQERANEARRRAEAALRRFEAGDVADVMSTRASGHADPEPSGPRGAGE